MDQIIIRKLKVKTVIGVHERERRKPQTLIMELTLHSNLQKAGITDKLTDTIDYAALIARIRRHAACAKFRLLEALAEQTAKLCLADTRVHAADVAVIKPNALTNACVGVSIHRKNRRQTSVRQ